MSRPPRRFTPPPPERRPFPGLGPRALLLALLALAGTVGGYVLAHWAAFFPG
jgi:hypothetical protein